MEKSSHARDRGRSCVCGRRMESVLSSQFLLDNCIRMSDSINTAGDKNISDSSHGDSSRSLVSRYLLW